MKQFLEKYDIPRKLLAILMAIALWVVVVVNNENVERESTFTNIPVTYLNEDTLTNDYGLSLIEGRDQTVTVKVSGPYAALNFPASDIQVKVNLSSFKTPGTYTISTAEDSSNCSLSILNHNSQGISKKYISSPGSFQIVIDEIISKEIPVTVQVLGQPADGYLYDDPEMKRETVTVTGPKSVVNQIQKVFAVVPEEDSTNLTKTTSLLASFTFLDENNQEVDKTHLTCEPNEMNVTIPVYAVARLPLTVDLVGSETLAETSVKAEISPAEISVYGTEAVISKLSEISLGELQLGTVTLNEPTIMTIQLPDGVTRLSGEPTSAKVTIKPVGMSTREIPVTNIELQNSGTNPNLVATLKTTSITIRIQADTAALANLTADALTVSAVFNADELGVGTHEVAIDVQSDTLKNSGSGFTVLNPDEKVTIEIKDVSAQQTPTEEENTTE